MSKDKKDVPGRRTSIEDEDLGRGTYRIDPKFEGAISGGPAELGQSVIRGLREKVRDLELPEN